MSLNITNVLARLDAMEVHIAETAQRGLAAAGNEAQQVMEANTAHGNITYATRTSYTAYVVGYGKDGQQAIDNAIASVESHNPGHSETEPVEMAETAVGLILTDPTNYQRYLETNNAGEKAVITPTFAGILFDLTRRAIEGK